MNAFKDVRVLTEAALAIALAFVLGLIKLFEMPFGGSVSLEVVPLILLALRQGPAVGITAGAAYGVLNLLAGAYVVHPVQFVLDYPLAFAAVGLAGLFPPTLRGAVAGTVAAVLARFVCHFLSGLVFFAANAYPGWSPAAYSAAYNAFYLVPILAIALAVVVVLLRALEGAQPSGRQLRYRRQAAS